MTANKGAVASRDDPACPFDLLSLASSITSGEYGVDEEHKAIMLRRLPHGFPACSRDCYIDPPVDG